MNQNIKYLQIQTSLAILIVFAIFLHSCAPKSSNDCGYQQNVYGQRISWKSKNSIPIYIDASVPATLKPAIFRAAKTWESYVGRQIFQIIDETNSKTTLPSRDRKNGIYFLSEWESDKKSEQGRTSVYWAGDEIQEADIRINAADFVYYDQDPKQLVKLNSDLNTGEAYNFEALILHELGHFLGLKHREGNGTVMATHLSSYTNRVSLVGSDASSVQCEY
jgi:hypothetical protein